VAEQKLLQSSGYCILQRLFPNTWLAPGKKIYALWLTSISVLPFRGCMALV